MTKRERLQRVGLSGRLHGAVEALIDAGAGPEELVDAVDAWGRRVCAELGRRMEVCDWASGEIGMLLTLLRFHPDPARREAAQAIRAAWAEDEERAAEAAWRN